MSENTRKPTLLESFIPMIFLILLLGLNVIYFGDDTLAGSNQIALLLAAALAGLLGVRLGIKWKSLLKGIVASIMAAMSSILILLLIGSLAGTWMISGIVPAMIYYGLKIISPTYLLVASVIVCALVSLATGSSWTTIATVGVALLGIGKALGTSEAVIAGAIISGAYFGDKMSPLSDTTNLAPAMAGTDLFTHIRYMTITTVPTLIITLIIFLVMGFNQSTNDGITDLRPILGALTDKFNVNPWLFIVPVAVIGMIIKKVPAVPALLAGSLLGGLAAVISQPQVIAEVAGNSGSYAKMCYIATMRAMYGEVSVTTSNSMVNELLSTGGMSGMLNTIWLILCAMVFGGVMEATGMLKRITEAIISIAHSTGSLIASTAATCMVFNVTASDQYLAIVVPGKMFEGIYRKRGLAPQNLSRTLEDTGTVTSVLVPWNTCGATQAGILGVATMAYAPYAFFSIISPFMTIFFGVAGIKIAKLKDNGQKSAA